MKKSQYLLVVCLLAVVGSACGQTPAKSTGAGDAKKGKQIFEENCGLCHDAESTEQKMGPGLKSLFKRPKLSTNGKSVNDANVMDKINTGGNGMPGFKEQLSDAERAHVVAYLKTI